MAVEVLKSRGVAEDRILFVNLIASPEGVTNFAKRFPKLRVVTAFVDQGLDDKKLVRGPETFFVTLTGMQLYCSGPRRLWRSILYPLTQGSLRFSALRTKSSSVDHNRVPNSLYFTHVRLAWLQAHQESIASNRSRAKMKWRC